MNYCPLNIVTCYQFLSSTLKIEDIYKVAKKFNYLGFGVNDFLTMHSYGDLYKYQWEYSLNPIYGAKINICFQDLEIPLSCYITNEQGYINLINLISKEKITLEDLSNHKCGLIAVFNFTDELRKYFAEEVKFSRLLVNIEGGFDEFYLGTEIYSSSDLDFFNNVRQYCQKHNFKSVTFNKNLYIKKEDAFVLDILQAIKNNVKLTEKHREGPYFFLGEKALKTLYTPDEIENTSNIYYKCENFKFLVKRGKLYSYPYLNKSEELLNRCKKRLIDLNLNTEEYHTRLNFELEIIHKMGYEDYFFIVEDYVSYAKNNNIPVGPGRGSAVGSLIAYLLNITEVDPIKYGLLFERFLNPERISMPDIDVDFADYRRNDICNYIQNHYGYDKFCYIITFQTYKVRGVLQDLERVYGLDHRDSGNILIALEGYSSFKEALLHSESFQQLMKDDYYKNIISLAIKIEGLPRQSSLHASGIIINNDSLLNSLPTKKGDNYLISQFDASILEKMGYLKMDILGITNLSIIENQINYVKKYYDPNFDIQNIPLNDQKTFDVLNNGLTSGIFQLESSGITKALKLVNISSFDDIISVIALYRPGPMDNIPAYAYNKKNRDKITYLNDDLKDILSSTYGIIVYQEQIMLIAQKVASYSLGKADLLRRAISKKNLEAMVSLSDDFVSNAINNGYSKGDAKKIYSLIEKFASFGFNKSHAVAYAYIAYRMAYIKANYPSCYFASILNYFSMNDSRVTSLRKELKYFSLSLHLPSITKSKTSFVIDHQNLIIPFTLIKGLNKNQITSILAIQQEDITLFSKLIKQCVRHHLNEEGIISLINAGALDEYNLTRTTLRRNVGKVLNYYQNIALDGLISDEELSLFLPKIESYPEDKSLKYELELRTVGILLSGSLLEPYQKKFQELHLSPIKENISKGDNNIIVVMGIIKNVRPFKTRDKRQMGTFIIEDDETELECLLFPSQYRQFIGIINNSVCVLVNGKINYDKNEDKVTLIVNEVNKVEEDK